MPDPLGKACRIEILSPTHHSQIGWDSTLNDIATLSVPTLKLRLKMSLDTYALCITSMIVHSCLKKTHITHRYVKAQINLEVYFLMPCVYRENESLVSWKEDVKKII